MHWQQHDAAQEAAAVSYSMALSFFPLLLVLISLGGWALRATGWGQDARQRLIDVISVQMDPSLATQVSALLDSVETNARTSGPLGLGMLVLTAMIVFAQFQAAFDRIWKVPPAENRGIVHTVLEVLWHRFRAFLMLMCVGVFLIAGFFGTMSITALEHYWEEWLPVPLGLWSLANTLAAVLLNGMLLTIMYRALPKANVRWRAAAGGGLLAALLWEVGRRLLASYVIGSKYSVYGVVGAFIAVMLWVYYAASVVFFGAEFVQVANRGRSAAPSAEKTA